MSSWPKTDTIGELLKRSKTIAVVGLSNSPLRPSYGVSAYMQSNGYHIIPVNPKIKGALGEKAYASLLEVPGKIDIVNIFRRPEFVEEIVDQAGAQRVGAAELRDARARGEPVARSLDDDGTRTRLRGIRSGT